MKTIMHPHTQHSQMQRQSAVGDRAADAARRTASSPTHGPQDSPLRRSHIMRTYSARAEACSRAAKPAGCGQSRRASPAFGRPPPLPRTGGHAPRVEPVTHQQPLTASGCQPDAVSGQATRQGSSGGKRRTKEIVDRGRIEVDLQSCRRGLDGQP